MPMFQVRVLREGLVQTIAYIEDRDRAREWGYAEMRLRRLRDPLPTRMWGSFLRSGTLFIDRIGSAKDLFAPDNKTREGLVLDRRMLEDPEVDVYHLFGIKAPSGEV